MTRSPVYSPAAPELDVYKRQAPNVRSIDVYWNDGLDSLIVPVELKTGYDSMSIILENMEEKMCIRDRSFIWRYRYRHAGDSIASIQEIVLSRHGSKT